MEHPRLSIVIACRNELAHVESALQSILAQQDVDGGFEILVAEGMSTDGTREVLQKLAGKEPRLLIIDNPEGIVSVGLNQAIRAARGEIIIRMDIHTDYAPAYVSTCLSVLDQTGADNVGGPARTRARNYFQNANALAYHSRFSVGGARFHNTSYEGWVDTVTYGCWRRETLERIGLFDEELVRNQDDELNLRLTRAGGRIWQSPRIKSWYYPRSSMRSLFMQYLQYGYWKVRVIQKHRLPASIRHVVPGGFVATILALGCLSPTSPIVRLILAGLLILYVAANISASVTTCRRRSDWKYLPVMPGVFAAYHFGYGLGFLLGVIDFCLLKKRGRKAFTALSR